MTTNASTTATTATPVCIAGMHRSGTSMITRLMNLCGLDLGPTGDLLSPTEDNPEGYWESRTLMIINDAILATFGGGWDFVPDLPDGWTTDARLLAIRAEASRQLQAFGSQQHWGWKDPRNSITGPFWSELVPTLKTLVCLRNPLEVGASLAKRGYASKQFSLDLWLKYNQAVLANTTPETRVVTHYESYFTNPEAELRRVCGLLGLHVTDEQLTAALATTNQGLRHSAARLTDLVNAEAPAEVITTYIRLGNEAGPVYQSVLQQELTALDRPLPAVGETGTEWARNYRTQRLEAIAGELVQRAGQAEQQLQGLIGQLSGKELELAKLRSRIMELEEQAKAA